MRPVAFPLLPIRSDGTCGCGVEKCTRVGKHPAVLWRDLAFGDAVPLPAEGAGYGLKTGAAPKGSGVVVVDLDGPEAISKWHELGGHEGDTYTVKTARGLHLYFAHPSFPCANTQGATGLWWNGKPKPESQAIDTRGDGGFVVGPGSPHASGVAYDLVVDMPPAPMPAWLLEWFRARASSVIIETVAVGDVTDPDEREHRRELFVDACRTMPPSIEGAAGDAALFRVVQHGAYDLALPVDDVLDIIAEHFDPRCVPPWGDELEERVRHKANDAKTKSTRPRAEPPPRELASLFNGGGGSARADATAPALAQPARTIVSVGGDELAKPLPPVSYLWRHFGVAPGRPTLLAGFGGVGKTFIAGAFGLAVAAGHGMIWDTSIGSGDVLLLDYEMTLAPTQRRLQRLAWGLELSLRATPFRVASMPEVYLSDADAEDALAFACDGKALAIVDNLAASTATSLEKENESGIRKYLDRLTRVTARTGCTFVVLAHERKGNANETGGTLQRVRGSSAITDACGAVISVSAAEGDGIVQLSQSKASVRRGGDSLLLRLEDVGSQPSPDEDAPGIRIVRVSERPDDTLSVIEARVLDVLSKGPQAGKRLIEAMIGGKKGLVGPAVDALVVRRKVAFIPGRGYVLDSPAARLERILAAAQVWGNVSTAQVAKAAGVDEAEVQELVAGGVLHRSGRAWIAVPSRAA